MISMKELLGEHHIDEVSFEITLNLEELKRRINIIRAAWGKPMIVTSGYRNLQDQKRINPKAMKSKHMMGCAVDIADPKGELYAWLQQNPMLLEAVDLYCELGTVDGPKKWVHFQSKPFGSYKPGGTRWFKA